MRRWVPIALGLVVGLAVLAEVLFSGAPGPLPPGEPDGFRLEAFFAGGATSTGTVTTAGLFEEPFTARFTTTREGDRVTVEEIFAFADGERLQRWVFEPRPGGTYRGTVETENGDGAMSAPVPVEGRSTATGAVLDYEGFAPGGGSMRLRFRHAMTALGDGTVLNRVDIRKWGLPLARARVVFTPNPS